VQGNVLNQIGLLADYKILKQELGVVLAELDHKLLNDLFEFNPTSELIAQHIFQKLKIQFTNQIKLAKVVVWESDKTCAAYFEE
jgi:6-pyruvoyltetrahydropterin/6-carboxytetrahydropterin synthase